MFCYQPEKPFGQTVMPGVYNSATELMTPELWRQLTTSPQTAWLVAKHREVKATLTDAKWVSDADFLDFDRRMRRLKSGPAKAYQAFDSDEKRVAAWCDSLKRRLPFVIFVATYPERTVKEGSQPAMWRNQKFAKLNGLVVLDVDHIEDPIGVFHRFTERLFRPPLAPPDSGGEAVSSSPESKGESTTLSSSPESGEVRRGLNEAIQKDGQRDFRPPLAPPDSGGDVGSSSAESIGESTTQNSSPESGEVRRGLNDLGILLVYVTPSGHGLKIVFKARTEWGNLIDNQLRLAKMLGLEADSSCKDAARGAFLTTKNDILYINEEELFTYENLEYAKAYNDQYRRGDSQPTISSPESGEARRGLNEAPQKDDKPDFRPPLTPPDSGGESIERGYHGVPYTKIVEAWLGGETPGKGDRHMTSLKLAYDLRYICDNDPKEVERVLRSLPWVQDIVSERGENVAATAATACSEKMRPYLPKRLSTALTAAGCGSPASPTASSSPESGEAGRGLNALDRDLPLQEWGEQIGGLKEKYPCLTECLRGLQVRGYAAGLFASAAFLGTVMTRTWYYFYHRPEERRRLNYCIFIIGDPASGKSFAGPLHRILCAPITTADAMSYDAVNRYKEETRTKGSNKEKPKKPVLIKRDHPSRTANGVFINDMNNAVEEVEGEPLHLHLITFDTELDNATSMSKGGQWIDKSSFELKAFHNEEDGQDYANLDSYSGKFYVYWNFVYTGTPKALRRKVTQQNFGSGLATRLAVIPLPAQNEMMPLTRHQHTDHQAEETMKTWAFRLDGVKGELPLWPLVEEAWHWTDERLAVANFNDDRADIMLLKRVAYYGIGIAAPFVMMRHWDEWQQKRTLTIDDTDRRLCRLVMDIQYRCQHYYFGEYARNYFDDMDRDTAACCRKYRSKYDDCYERLPKEFRLDDIEHAYNISRNSSSVMATRLISSGAITRIKQGLYRKLKHTLQ